MRQNHDKARKAAARKRAARTGESYTTALRKVTSAPVGSPEPATAIKVSVSAYAILTDFGIEGSLDTNKLHTAIKELERDDELVQALRDDLWAVESLMASDEDAYLAALLPAVEQVAASWRLDVDARPLPSGMERKYEGPVAADVLAVAAQRAVLPQLGKAPRYAPDGMSIREAVKAAGRTYLQRIRTDERPDVAAERAQQATDLDTLAKVKAVDLRPVEPAVPLDSLSTYDVVTLQPIADDGSASKEPIVAVVQRADEHSISIGSIGKVFRYHGRLMLESTGDLFDVIEDSVIPTSQAAMYLAARDDIFVDVTDEDVRSLTGRGDLTIYRYTRREALYSCIQLGQVNAARVAEVVDEREAWIANSYSLQEAARRLGWEEDVVRDTAMYFEILEGGDRISSKNVDLLAEP